MVGELTRQWRRFRPAIEAEVAMGLPGGHPPHGWLVERNMARLCGTVALVLQKHFGPSAGLQEPEVKESQRKQSLAS